MKRQASTLSYRRGGSIRIIWRAQRVNISACLAGERRHLKENLARGEVKISRRNGRNQMLKKRHISWRREEEEGDGEGMNWHEEGKRQMAAAAWRRRIETWQNEGKSALRNHISAHHAL